MFKARIYLSIWLDAEAEEGKTTLFRDVELPFAPFIGLSLSSQNWSCSPLRKIHWSQDDQRFVCEIDDQRPYSDDDNDYTYDWLVQDALDNGWRK